MLARLLPPSQWLRYFACWQITRLFEYLSVIECFETDGGVNYRSDRLI